MSTATFGCQRAAQNNTTAAQVNGKAVPRAEVEKYFRLRTQQMPQKPAGDMANLMKLEILRELIASEVMLQKAAQLKLLPTDAEVEAEVKKVRGSASEEEFRKTI